MNLVRCNQGHFYDGEVYQACPHCSGAGNDNVTMPAAAFGNDNVTVAMGAEAPMIPSQPAAPVAPLPVVSEEPSSLLDAVNASITATPIQMEETDNKTVGFFSSSIGKEPVVGWLVCIEGEHFGEDFRLKSGRNFIGRGSNMDVCIQKDNTVSRERHAIVVYEPRGNLFLMQPGDSKELCYLNDSVVLSPQPLNSHDVILVGETELLFVPCCTPTFSWSAKKKEKKMD